MMTEDQEMIRELLADMSGEKVQVRSPQIRVSGLLTAPSEPQKPCMVSNDHTIFMFSARRVVGVDMEQEVTPYMYDPITKEILNEVVGPLRIVIRLGD